MHIATNLSLYVCSRLPEFHLPCNTIRPRPLLRDLWSLWAVLSGVVMCLAWASVMGAEVAVGQSGAQVFTVGLKLEDMVACFYQLFCLPLP